MTTTSHETHLALTQHSPGHRRLGTTRSSHSIPSSKGNENKGGNNIQEIRHTLNVIMRDREDSTTNVTPDDFTGRSLGESGKVRILHRRLVPRFSADGKCRQRCDTQACDVLGSYVCDDCRMTRRSQKCSYGTEKEFPYIGRREINALDLANPNHEIKNVETSHEGSIIIAHICTVMTLYM